MTAPEVEAPPRCAKCRAEARFVVSSAWPNGRLFACGRHLGDRVTYGLGFAMRVDVRLVEVTA